MPRFGVLGLQDGKCNTICMIAASDTAISLRPALCDRFLGLCSLLALAVHVGRSYNLVMACDVTFADAIYHSQSMDVA